LASVVSIRWTTKGEFAREVAVGEPRRSGLRRGGDAVVYPTGTVLNVRRLKVTGALYVYLELPSRPGRWRWLDFKRECKRMGLQLPKTVVSRLVPAAFADLVLRWTDLGH
jgi:hypothetical protein